MLAPSEMSAQKVESPLPIVEASGGVAHSKDGRGIGDLVDAKTAESWGSRIPQQPNREEIEIEREARRGIPGRGADGKQLCGTIVY